MSAGTFNAVEVSRALGLGLVGDVRGGLSAYTGDDDVDRLLESLNEYTNYCPARRGRTYNRVL